MDNLQEILDNHVKWINGEAGGQRADLIGADLRGADLREADLREADLREADLRGADLREAIKIPMFCKWSHGITDGQIHIGCEKRSIDEWKEFIKSDEVIQTPRDSDEFKQIVRVIKAYIAYLE